MESVKNSKTDDCLNKQLSVATNSQCVADLDWIMKTDEWRSQDFEKPFEKLIQTDVAHYTQHFKRYFLDKANW